MCDNCPGGPVSARVQDGRFHRRPSATDFSRGGVYAGTTETPDVGFPLQREVRDIPGEVVRRVWNENLRDYETVQSPDGAA